MGRYSGLLSVLVFFLIITGCGVPGDSTDHGLFPVSIRLVEGDDYSESNRSYRYIPPEIYILKCLVSAHDMEDVKREITITQEMRSQGYLEIILMIPEGLQRMIEVEAFNVSYELLSRAWVVVDIPLPDEEPVKIVMSYPDVTEPVFAGLLSATLLPDNRAELTWNAAFDVSTPATSIRYLVYRSTVPGSYDFVSPALATPRGVTSFRIGGMLAGETYYYVVRAMDDFGNDEGNMVERSVTLP